MAIDDEIINEDLSMMDERAVPPKTLSAELFARPVKEMHPSPPVIIDIEDSLQEALMFMQLKQFGCVLVAKRMKLAGILTERDIIAKVVGQEEAPHAIKVRDVMTPNPEAFREDDSIAFVMRAMTIGGYRHVPIVDEKNEPIGIVSVKDIIRFIVEHFAEELMNLPPTPIRTTLEREGA